MKGIRIFYLVLLGDILLSMWGMLWLIPWQSAAIQQREEQSRDQQNVITGVQNFMNGHLDFNAYEKDLQERQKVVELQFPEHVSQGSFLLLVQREALAQKMTIHSIMPEKQQSLEGVVELPVNLEVTGSYWQLLDFLSALGKAERFLRIGNMVLKNQQGILDCRLQLFIYAESV